MVNNVNKEYRKILLHERTLLQNLPGNDLLVFARLCFSSRITIVFRRILK